MSTLITINVTNNSSIEQNFFFFQKPAIYVGGSTIYSNSLFTGLLQPSATSGASLSFSMNLQYYAGVQEQVAPPAIGQSSGLSAAIQAIGLTPAVGGAPTNNTTTMSLTPSLGLSDPISTTGPEPNSFRIVTPIYNPVPSYNAGSAIQSADGTVTLSNFVVAQPNDNLDCQPILNFYVATGTYTPGTVMNFTSASADSALCDATTGYHTFNVSYNADGTWTVNPFALVRINNAKTLIPASVTNNVSIKNEAGTAVISTGFAASFNAPLVVQALSQPGALHVHSEYQVGPSGGPFTGRMCTALAGNVGTFQ